ncbi:cytochrome P450 2A11-like isoform X2 [Dermacentor variabilis]|uniref:cytochrome P450 2A11-like isoform X2 n=1 Tax=Dermacentor variabilis TaxID=34621 RepID=UPI003F5B0DD8
MDMNVGRVQNFISYIFEWGSFWMVFTTWLTVIIAAMLAINSFREKNGGQKNKLTAPGPGAVPILGYLPFLRKPYHTTFKELSKQYGPIIKIRLGCKDVLVLNDLASIREGLSNPDVLYRPNDFIFRHLGIEDFLPALRFVAARLPGTQLYAMKSVLQELAKFIRKEVQERGATMEEHADKDFIDGYLRKIEEYKGKDSYFTLSALVGSTVNFYSAATNTVRSAVLWNLYIAASDPDGLQARVQREIDAAIGREAAPAWEDRRRTPFTMACILETLRWRTTAPLGLQRAAGRDTEICGYYVTAGTMVVANLWSLHNDPLHWSEPLKYDPTRFLNADGTEVEKKPEAFLPFGAGRRQCPGEKLALMEVFLYVATTLQRFRVLPEEGKTISLATAPALISVVNEMQGLRFIPRW